MGRLQQPGTTDRYRLTFQLGGRQAVFEIRAGIGAESVRPRLLRDFQCPSACGARNRRRRGFYGKLPARGDFVRAALPRDFTDRWDAWLSA